MIILKSKDEIEKMRSASRVVAEVLQELRKAVRPGMTTLELDAIAERGIRGRGAIPAFKGYRGFPNTLCVSVNEQVVHGIPSKRRLKEGDLVGLDLGAIWEGYYGDAAVTVTVGRAAPEAEDLLTTTREALHAGINQARPGNHLSDISHAIQTYAEARGYSVVRAFVGHGIGTALHEEPQLPNFGPPSRGPRLKAGMVLAIEPMVNIGEAEVEILDDGWTVVTADGQLSAHFEHTIAITERGPEILSVV
ncbi:MAG: type I methionyl aminopeptidase [Nitrospinae bacterium]|nr:type I methionyl aminopeptidase [Nitrospinota bacterium]